MTSPIDNYFSGYNNKYSVGLQLAENFWHIKTDSDNDSDTADAWSIVAGQCDARVNLCLENVGQHVVLDLAQDAASYLADYPDLADDYVLAIIDDPTQGREARAYRKSDLLAVLDEPQKSEAAEALENDTLLYFDSADGLPDTTDDPEVQGLAEVAQDFLDNHSKLLNILSREGFQPWES